MNGPTAVAWLLLVLGAFYGGRRLWWKVRGKDPRRNLQGRSANREYEWRWSTWNGGRLRCAYRYALLPGCGPFLCSGPHRRGHQVAHSNGGSSTPENIMCLCDRHNDAMRTRASLAWWIPRAIPVAGHALLLRRMIWAEMVRRWLWRPPTGWAGARRKR